jgi:hypothetical protein
MFETGSRQLELPPSENTNIPEPRRTALNSSKWSWDAVSTCPQRSVLKRRDYSADIECIGYTARANYKNLLRAYASKPGIPWNSGGSDG